MTEQLERLDIYLSLPGAQAVAAKVATWVARFRGRIIDTQFSLAGTGTGAGSTTVQVNVNGVAVHSGLSIAGAAAQQWATKAPTVGLAATGTFSGVPFNIGDVITVDVAAIPATTASTNGAVHLDVVETDI